MMEELLIRYAHFIGIMLLASMLVTENFLLEKRVKANRLKRLVIIDGLYGLGALIALLAGLALWLWVGKPSNFYSGNFIFHIKLSLFVVIALMSIYPTVFLLKNRNTSLELFEIPASIIWLKRLELILLIVLPFMAVLIARGVGLTQ